MREKLLKKRTKRRIIRPVLYKRAHGGIIAAEGDT
jgi:hypothetical protein